MLHIYNLYIYIASKFNELYTRSNGLNYNEIPNFITEIYEQA